MHTPSDTVDYSNYHLFYLQVTDVTSTDFRCYTSETQATASTVTIAAGSQLGIWADQAVYHPGVVNVYMAKAPSGTDVASWDGSGNVWFKVYQIPAVTDGGKTISWPAQNQPGYTFTVPKNLPSGQYLVRIEQIALHVAQTYGGAQFYVRLYTSECVDMPYLRIIVDFLRTDQCYWGWKWHARPLGCYPWRLHWLCEFLSLMSSTKCSQRSSLGAWNSDQYQCESCALGI